MGAGETIIKILITGLILAGWQLFGQGILNMFLGRTPAFYEVYAVYVILLFIGLGFSKVIIRLVRDDDGQ